jgi:alpha,alpha-trehalase
MARASDPNVSSTQVTEWSLVYQGFDPAAEGLREALCTLGNGYVATRGAGAEVTADGTHYPGTYVGGCYNRLETEMAGRVVGNEDLVNVPNWLVLTFRIDGGGWFSFAQVDVLSYRQELNLATGVLVRSVRFRDAEGRETALEARRLVHMGAPHLAAHETTITALNWAGRLDLRTALDGRVVNTGVERYRALAHQHLVPLEVEVREDRMFLRVQTSQSRVELAMACRTRVFTGGQIATPDRRGTAEPGLVAQDITVEAVQDVPVTVEKVVSLFTSRDRAISECGLEATKAVQRAGSFDELMQGHARAWEHLWRRFDIALETERDDGNPGSELGILRLHVFHLLQTVSPHIRDLDVGVPARGLHGEAYRGHVFWDELFIFPLLNLRMPEITRALLMYRYRRLPEARRAAEQAGYHGAMFPWQRHVNSAIAYNVWQYYQVTVDFEFLSFFGAELLLEIARFWSSISVYNPELGRYEIRGVMGPDEYHDGYPDTDKPGLNNNAYTNLMAVWVLCRALDVLELLPEDRSAELRARLGLSPEEIARWVEISHKMHLVFTDGVLQQFEGYDRLDELDWDRYREQYADIHRLDRILEAEGDSANRYKLSKQADVLMLFYLFSTEELQELFERLGYPFDPATIPKTIDYYMSRTSHGSTLSRIVDAWVLSRSFRSGSWELFSEALESDVADIQGGTTAEGIHLGAMAGTVDIVQRCYTGIETRGDVLRLNPWLPERLRCVRLRVTYRGQAIQLEITHEHVTVTALPSGAGSITLAIGDETFELQPGQTRITPLAAKT